MKVLVCDTLPEQAFEILKQAKIDVVYKTGMAPEELKAEIQSADGVIIRSATKLTADVIEAAESLRAVCRAGVGIDNVDVTAATKRGVIVMNTPGGNTRSTAEHTIAMLLSLSRNIPQANASLRDGKWDKKSFKGTQVAEKVLGIIGLGRVGYDVARCAVGLDMKVIGFDPFIDRQKAHDLGVELVADPKDIYPRADYITVHTPMTPETEGMIGEKEFAMMKKGVRILNCARGGIIDEAALYDAIRSGQVAGAALDVFIEEPPTDRRLVELPQVVCTPHLAASTEEAQIMVAEQAAAQLADALLDRGVRHAVNLPSLDLKEADRLRPYIALAEKMGMMQIQLSPGRIKSVEITYSGEIAKGDLTMVTSSYLTGLLRPMFDQPINMVNAPLMAQSRNIALTEHKSEAPRGFANLIRAEVETADGSRSTQGTLFGQDNIRIVSIDDYHVEVVPEGNVLVIFDMDRPGLIGGIGTVLGRHNINIARMTFGRQEAGGKAITALNVDH
ncbi:MAG: phosphoglycerate dehydrogenase, partial [Planctomycetes bacterium]|nr:phosphoglycerate dehydrogenase [Planctomycetota bacterium]